jgi:hypothetical protein
MADEVDAFVNASGYLSAKMIPYHHWEDCRTSWTDAGCLVFGRDCAHSIVNVRGA